MISKLDMIEEEMLRGGKEMSKNKPPEKCLVCGGTIFVKLGIDHTKQGRFQRWKCTGCATTVKGEKL